MSEWNVENETYVIVCNGKEYTAEGSDDFVSTISRIARENGFNTIDVEQDGNALPQSIAKFSDLNSNSPVSIKKHGTVGNLII